MITLAEFFPAGLWEQPDRYAAKTLRLAELQANVTALRIAAMALGDTTRLKEFRDIATKKVEGEESRQSSIMTRAQGLFVALALFGFLFTFGASFMTQTTRVDRWVLWVALAFVLFILLQIVLMVFNILRAIRGINHRTSGSSDLTRWLSLPTEGDFYRAQALLTLEHYREAALYNNWRFEHLTFAFKGLRNIVFALSALILFLFVVGILTPPPVQNAQPPIWRGHRWERQWGYVEPPTIAFYRKGLINRSEAQFQQ